MAGRSARRGSAGVWICAGGWRMCGTRILTATPGGPGPAGRKPRRGRLDQGSLIGAGHETVSITSGGNDQSAGQNHEPHRTHSHGQDPERTQAVQKTTAQNPGAEEGRQTGQEERPLSRASPQGNTRRFPRPARPSPGPAWGPIAMVAIVDPRKGRPYCSRASSAWESASSMNVFCSVRRAASKRSRAVGLSPACRRASPM